MTTDALGIQLHKGDLIAYGSGQGHQKAGFRIGLVIDTEKPTVVPFELGYDWRDTGPRDRKWVRMRTFGFPEVKKGDFAIITNRPKNKQLEEEIYKAEIEYKLRMI